MAWVDYIEKAFKNLGGKASYDDLYPEVDSVRKAEDPTYKPTQQWKATVRKTIENFSSDSDNYRPKRPDLFYSVGGKGSGRWGLRNYVPHTPPAIDIEEQEPAAPNRVSQETYRILRDTELARTIKEKHEYKCQLCSTVIILYNGKKYAEAHHIKPIGKPHNGPDIADNIICLCPNCHVKMDYGAIELSLSQVGTAHGHAIGEQYAQYHNHQIFGKE